MSIEPVTSLARRRFLQRGVAMSAGLAASVWSDGVATLWGASPPQRNGAPYMKLSLAAYSFNRLLARNWTPPAPGVVEEKPKLTLADVIDFCAAQNLDAVELTSYYFPKEVTLAYLNSLKEQTFRLGLDISGTAIGNDFCLPEGAARDGQLELTRKWIDHAVAMRAPVIRIFAGKVPAGDTEEVALERCVAGIEESLKYAAERGVALALENHGGITATPELLLEIVKRVGDSPWFGVNFDSGNFRTADPYGDLEKIAPYAINAQIKVAIAPDGKKEVADLERIVKILKNVNYRGYVILEYEEADDPFEVIPGYLKQLRSLIQA